METHVGRRSFRLDSLSIDIALGMRSEGFLVQETKMWPVAPGFETLECVRRLRGDPQYPTATRPTYRDMTLEARLLHVIIRELILPRRGHRDEVSYLDCFLIDSILVGRRVHLSALILLHMSASVRGRTTTLPYGRFLTRVFRHFRVDMGSEQMVSHPISVDTIDDTTLLRMGYVRFEDAWHTKADMERLQRERAQAAGVEIPTFRPAQRRRLQAEAEDELDMDFDVGMFDARDVFGSEIPPPVQPQPQSEAQIPPPDEYDETTGSPPTMTALMIELRTLRREHHAQGQTIASLRQQITDLSQRHDALTFSYMQRDTADREFRAQMIARDAADREFRAQMLAFMAEMRDDSRAPSPPPPPPPPPAET